MALNRWQKGLVYITRAKTRRYSVPCLSSTGRVCIRRFKFFAVLCVSGNNCESAVHMDLVIKINFSV